MRIRVTLSALASSCLLVGSELLAQGVLFDCSDWKGQCSGDGTACVADTDCPGLDCVRPPCDLVAAGPCVLLGVPGGPILECPLGPVDVQDVLSKPTFDAEGNFLFVRRQLLEPNCSEGNIHDRFTHQVLMTDGVAEKLLVELEDECVRGQDETNRSTAIRFQTLAFSETTGRLGLVIVYRPNEPGNTAVEYQTAFRFSGFPSTGDLIGDDEGTDEDTDEGGQQPEHQVLFTEEIRPLGSGTRKLTLEDN